jgi:hypothetical protein
MTYLNYDPNKLSLGKLSKNTLKKGNFALRDISEVLAIPNITIKILNARHYSKFNFNSVPT